MEFRLKMLCRKYYKIPPNQHLWEGGRSQVLGSFSSLPVSMVLWLRQFLPNQEGSYLYFLAAGKMKYIRQWPPVAGDRYQNSWWGGRIGWQRIFRARSKSTSQKKLMIYIYRHIWMIYIDLLWYTQKALKLYHQLLNPHLSVNPQPRFGCISLTFGINQFHVGFKLQGSEHNQCWSCFAIFGCASQPASGSQSRLLRRVTVTRSQTRCLAQWCVWSVRCSQFAFPRRAP